jgi:site-specific recombinase XerD
VGVLRNPFTGKDDVSQYVSAIRFLFVKTLRRHFLTEHIPFPKSPRRLPVVLSPEEVTRLIDAARNLYHRTLLMTLYSTAVRRSELCRLQTSANTKPICFKAKNCRRLGSGPSLSGDRWKYAAKSRTIRM